MVIQVCDVEYNALAYEVIALINMHKVQWQGMQESLSTQLLVKNKDFRWWQVFGTLPLYMHMVQYYYVCVGVRNEA